MRVLVPLFCLVPLLSIGNTLLPGLLITEYPRHFKQVDSSKPYLPVEEFGDPVGPQSVTSSVNPWRHNNKRNAVVRGLLKIDADGEYGFITDNFPDHNLLVIDGRLVCPFADGSGRPATISLKKGYVEFLCAGYLGGSGDSGINVLWRPPGASEVGPIPADHLFHPADTLLANWMTIVTKDFVIDAWINGIRVPDQQRQPILDLYGSTVERFNASVRKGDWVVFNVTHNRMRHGGAKYFAVAGNIAKNRFGFVTDPVSPRWSVCDEPSQVAEFIAGPEPGVGLRPSSIRKKWHQGDGLIRQHGGKNFSGKPLWGKSSSTWIKFTAPPAPPSQRLSSTRLSDLERP